MQTFPSAGSWSSPIPAASGDNGYRRPPTRKEYGQGRAAYFPSIEFDGPMPAIRAHFRIGAKAQQRTPGTTKEFRRVLDDKDIDGIIIAVPDHWHAHITMLACQAGKDIYIEKPVSRDLLAE